MQLRSISPVIVAPPQTCSRWWWVLIENHKKLTDKLFHLSNMNLKYVFAQLEFHRWHRHIIFIRDLHNETRHTAQGHCSSAHIFIRDLHNETRHTAQHHGSSAHSHRAEKCLFADLLITDNQHSYISFAKQWWRMMITCWSNLTINLKKYGFNVVHSCLSSSFTM